MDHTFLNKYFKAIRPTTGKWTQSNGVSGGFELVLSPNGEHIEGRRWVGDKEGEGTKRTWSGKRIE